MVIDVKLMMLMVARCHFQRIYLLRAATTERGDSRGSLMGPEAPLEADKCIGIGFGVSEASCDREPRRESPVLGHSYRMLERIG